MICKDSALVFGSQVVHYECAHDARQHHHNEAAEERSLCSMTARERALLAVLSVASMPSLYLSRMSELLVHLVQHRRAHQAVFDSAWKEEWCGILWHRVATRVLDLVPRWIACDERAGAQSCTNEWKWFQVLNVKVK